MVAPAPGPGPGPLLTLLCRRETETETENFINVYNMDGNFTSKMMKRRDPLLDGLKRIDDYKLIENGQGFRAAGILAPPVRASVGSSNAMAVHFVAPNSQPQVLVEMLSPTEMHQLLIGHLKDQLRCGWVSGVLTADAHAHLSPTLVE